MSDNSFIDWFDPEHDRFKDPPKLLKGDILIMRPESGMEGYKIKSSHVGEIGKLVLEGEPKKHGHQGFGKIIFTETISENVHPAYETNYSNFKRQPVTLLEIYEKDFVKNKYPIFVNANLIDGIYIQNAILLFDVKAGQFLVKNCLDDLHSFKEFFCSVHRNGKNIL